MAMPKWEREVRDRLRSAIRKFSRPLKELAERDANEGDTRLLVTDFLCDALGFDKYADLTTEYQVRGQFADFGIRIEGEVIAFIEVKRIKTKLSPRHLRQVQSYAVNEGTSWAILTSGAQWQVYHFSSSTPIRTKLVLAVDLLGEGTANQKAEGLYYLTRESLQRRQLDELWVAKRATAPATLARVLLSERVVDEIRKELRRQTDHRTDGAEIADLLRDTVIRPDVLDET